MGMTCKTCAKALGPKNTWGYCPTCKLESPEYRERRAAIERDRRASDPEYNAKRVAYNDGRREQINAARRDYVARNREAVRATNAAWLESHPGYNAASATRWAAAHPERRRATGRKGAITRRARVMDAFVEHVDPAVVWERDGGICHICREPADPTDWHLEHVMPLVRGGEHSYTNTAVSHPTCNRRKAARVPS